MNRDLRTVPQVPAWFCVRSQTKHEHIAAARLRESGIEVFLPRIRFRKSSVRGPVWVTEALFPNYLFARFDWHAAFRLVRHAAGVRSVVSFGATVATVPEQIIADLRASIGEEELRVIKGNLEPGDQVQFSGGAFHGLTAVVNQVMPAKERVKVLLNFLGQQTSVEVRVNLVVPEGSARRRIL